MKFLYIFSLLFFTHICLSLSSSDQTDFHAFIRLHEEIKKSVQKAHIKLRNLEQLEKVVAIFDIDDTIVSHFHFNTQNRGRCLVNQTAVWRAYVQEAYAPRIDEVYFLYRYLIDKGVSVIFLTGRPDEYYVWTKLLLERLSYNRYEKLIMRTKEDKARYTSIGQFKAAKRKEIADSGYTILMCIGDQLTDCTGDYTGIAIKIPNDLYSIE